MLADSDVPAWFDERYSFDKLVSYDVAPGVYTKNPPGFVQFPMEDKIIARFRVEEYPFSLEEVTYSGNNLFYDIPVKNFSIKEFLSEKHFIDGKASDGKMDLHAKLYYGVKFKMYSFSILPFGE